MALGALNLGPNEAPALPWIHECENVAHTMRNLRILGSVLLVALGIAIYEGSRSASRRGQLERIRVHMEGIQGARLTYLTDLEENPEHPLEAEFDIPGKGRMLFTFLKPDSFQETPRLSLVRIGNHKFIRRARHGEHAGYGIGLNVSTDTSVPEVRDLQITNVQSALDRYEELSAIIETWPRIDQEWPSGWPVDDANWAQSGPEEIGFTDTNGSPIFFSLQRVKAKDQSGGDAAEETGEDPN